MLASIVDEELAAARARIVARLGAVFEGGVPAPTASRLPGAATPARADGGRSRSSAQDLAAFQKAVLAAVPAGQQVSAAAVVAAVGAQVTRALLEAKKLKLLGSRGGASYVRR